MTAVKINGRPSASASEAVERYADTLYRNQGARIVVVAELKHAARTEPAPDEEKDRSVELKISALEVASPEQAEDLRKAMRALHLHRTAQGTLDEDGDIELANQTLRLCGDRLADVESAQLRAALRHWSDYTNRVFRTSNITETELRHELDNIRTGLERALNPAEVEQ